MPVSVDPFLYPIPSVFLQNKETRDFFEYLVKHLADNNQRTGGANDLIDDLVDRIFAEDSRRISEVRELTRELRRLEIELQFKCSEVDRLRRKLADMENAGSDIKAVVRRLESRLNDLELS